MVREIDDDGCRSAGTGQIGELSERVGMGLSVNAIDSVRGCTLLMHAVLGNGGTSSQINCIEFLLAQDADLEARSTSGDTALVLAALCGHLDAAELLIQAGASPLATGAAGMSPLECAETRRQGEFDFQPGKAAVARLLRECGA
jgi:ankyrin repeat protein